MKYEIGPFSDAEKIDFDSFIEKLKGIPGHKVIMGLNFLQQGIDFQKCTKYMMAESWAKRNSKYGHAALRPITLDMIVAKIEETYPGGKSTMGPERAPWPPEPAPPRVRIDDLRASVKAALTKVNSEIAVSIDRSSKYSSGLAYEGYQGGYLDCLNDMVLLLNGVKPQRRNYWA